MPRSKVDLFAAIRRDSRVEGLSVRGLARKYGVHRRTVREALSSAWPRPRKKLPPRRSRLVSCVRPHLAATISRQPHLAGGAPSPSSPRHRSRGLDCGRLRDRDDPLCRRRDTDAASAPASGRRVRARRGGRVRGRAPIDEHCVRCDLCMGPHAHQGVARVQRAQHRGGRFFGRGGLGIRSRLVRSH